MNVLEANNNVVILDRDGTIVVDRHYLGDPAGLEFLPGSADGLRLLAACGFRLVVITNQSGVGRGMFPVRRLHEIHDRLREMICAIGVSIEGIYSCTHAPEVGCACRKPRAGLLLRAASELGFIPSRSIVIGDKASDVEFGRNAGATTVLITPYGEINCEPAPDFCAVNLLEAARRVGHLAGSN